MAVVVQAAPPAAGAAAAQRIDEPLKLSQVSATSRVPVLLLLTEDSAASAYARVMESDQRVSTMSTSHAALVERAAQAGRDQAAVAMRQQERVLEHLAQTKSPVKVIYRVHNALNAIAVEADASDVEELGKVSDVSRVVPLNLEYPTANRPVGSNAVPFMNVPTVWSLPASVGNADGTGVSIGIIDTGIDYLHPDFGGSGLLADYTANDHTTAAPYFPTAKVVGGTDLAGDNYNGSAGTIAADSDPMDCNGHGSHVAGIASGLGVTSGGATYAGPYNSSTSYNGMRIQPGVAPKASLYAIRVFGCGGGTNLTIAGIDWAMDPNGDSDLSDHLDVINMSLGSELGSLTSTSAMAADAAASIGMAVAVSAGNSGDTYYIAGSPGVADRVTTVAASVDNGQLGQAIRVNAPAGIAGWYANTTATAFGGVPPAGGFSGNVVLALDPADVAGPSTTDGCTAFTNVGAVTGNVAIVDRGTCGFLQKAQNAQAAGATGLIIASNSAAAIGGMAGVDPSVTIPVVLISQADGVTIKANLGAGVNVTFFNGGDNLASFSSRGGVTDQYTARVKPDVAAPGLNITSVQTGTTCTVVNQCLTSNPTGYLAGGQTLTISGTSMACPQIAGVSALMKQLHPDWSSEEIKAAIVNGASHAVTYAPEGNGATYVPSRAGAGRTDPPASATTSALAFNAENVGAVSVAFSEDFVTAGTRTKKVRVENKSSVAVSYNLSINTILDASGLSFSLPGGSTLTVPANSSTTLNVQLNADPSLMKHTRDTTVSATQASPSPVSTVLNRQWLTEEQGYLVFKVGSTETMRVPLYATSRPASAMSGPAAANGPGATGSGTLALSGTGVCSGALAASVCTGTFPTDEVSLVTPFELQAVSPVDQVNSTPSADIQYAGVAYDSANTTFMFGVSTYGDWGSPGETSFNIYIDGNNDGTWDKVLFSSNPGSIDKMFGVSTSGTDPVINGVFTISTSGVALPSGSTTRYVTGDPALLDNALTRSNVAILTAAAATLGITPGSNFKWKVVSCPGWAPLCQALNGFHYDEAAGPYLWNTAAQGLNFSGTRLAQDLPGATLPVSWDTTNITNNGTLGALLLHTHNKSGNRAQYIPLDSASTADLSTTISLSPANAHAGQNVTATVTLHNNGSAAASSVQVALNAFGGSASYVSDDGAGAFSTSTWAWTVPSLASGATTTLHVVMQLGSDEPITFTDVIGSSTPLDPIASNNSATVTYAPGRVADLHLAAVASASPAHPGDTVSYTFTATNNGGDAAYSIQLGDSITGGLVATSATPSSGVYNASTHTWNLAGLDNSRSATLQLDFVVPTMTGSLTDSGTVSSSINDPATGDNTASASVTILSPALITATMTREGAPEIRALETYTVVLTNVGTSPQLDNPGDEFNVTLPTGLTLTGASATSGSATTSGSTVHWNGMIDAGASVTITFTATVDVAAAGQTLSVQGTAYFDADGNGTNESTVLTDDPTLAGRLDATAFAVLAQVPALSLLGLLGLALFLGTAALIVLRK